MELVGKRNMRLILAKTETRHYLYRTLIQPGVENHCFRKREKKRKRKIDGGKERERERRKS